MNFPDIMDMDINTGYATIESVVEIRNLCLSTLASFENGVRDLRRSVASAFNNILPADHPDRIDLNFLPAAAVAQEGKPGEEKKRKRKAHDPNAPKRALTSYFLFMGKVKPQIKEQHPDWTASQVSEESEERWRTIEPEEKKKYELLYNIDLARYYKQLELYREGKPFHDMTFEESRELYDQQVKSGVPFPGRKGKGRLMVTADGEPFTGTDGQADDEIDAEGEDESESSSSNDSSSDSSDSDAPAPAPVAPPPSKKQKQAKNAASKPVPTQNVAHTPQQQPQQFPAHMQPQHHHQQHHRHNQQHQNMQHGYQQNQHMHPQHHQQQQQRNMVPPPMTLPSMPQQFIPSQASVLPSQSSQPHGHSEKKKKKGKQETPSQQQMQAPMQPQIQTFNPSQFMPMQILESTKETKKERKKKNNKKQQQHDGMH